MLFILANIWGITTLNAQTQLNLLGQLPYEQAVNDVWGYAADNGDEYALVGTQTGLSIVDLRNPMQPEELFFIDGPHTTWRDMKTFGLFAYTINEKDTGLLITDLSQLPDTVFASYYLGGTDSLLKKAHNLWIDDAGYLYVIGYNDFENGISQSDRGTLIFDLNANATEPPLVGIYNDAYVHDAYVRNDTMYTAEIYEGNFTVVDVSDKANPTVLATQSTPNNFTHNVWLSNNGNVLFTTDERNDAYIAAYDITDLGDIAELDRWQSSPGQKAMPHNVHVINDFLVISYYTDGVRIVDARQPDALIETAYYDTSPDEGKGSKGCWGAYPFLPSGLILASDRQEGLFVLEPNYPSAVYVQGTITDAQTNAPLQGVLVSVNGTNNFDLSEFAGDYKTGAAQSGIYSLTFNKYGYDTLSISGIALDLANITELNVELEPLTDFVYTIQVIDEQTGLPVEGANIELSDHEMLYELQTDADGLATIVPYYEYDFDVLAYKWGWHTQVLPDLGANIAEPNMTIALQKGYYDDFYIDFDWDISNSGKVIGGWTRAEPRGTLIEDTLWCNPDEDMPDDMGELCYMTGNSAGTQSATDGDLDNGSSTLTSPAFNLDDYADPYLYFNTWFCGAATDTAENKLQIFLKRQSDGASRLLYTFNAFFENKNQWLINAHRVADFFPPEGNMQLVLRAVAGTPSTITDVSLDVFFISEEAPPVGLDLIEKTDWELTAYPNPFAGVCRLHYKLPQFPETSGVGVELRVYDLTGKLVESQSQTAGKGDFLWGKSLPSGMYLLQTGNGLVGYRILKALKN